MVKLKRELYCDPLPFPPETVIQWPQRRDIPPKAEEFERVAGLPGVVGAIDGTYIKIKGKTDNTRDSYICRKGYPAMHLQVIVT